MLRFLLRFLRPRFERRFVLEYGERKKKEKVRAPNHFSKTKQKEELQSAQLESENKKARETRERIFPIKRRVVCSCRRGFPWSSAAAHLKKRKPS